jgi:hypothetical protein
MTRFFCMPSAPPASSGGRMVLATVTGVVEWRSTVEPFM